MKIAFIFQYNLSIGFLSFSISSNKNTGMALQNFDSAKISYGANTKTSSAVCWTVKLSK